MKYFRMMTACIILFGCAGVVGLSAKGGQEGPGNPEFRQDEQMVTGDPQFYWEKTLGIAEVNEKYIPGMTLAHWDIVGPGRTKLASMDSWIRIRADEEGNTEFFTGGDQEWKISRQSGGGEASGAGPRGGGGKGSGMRPSTNPGGSGERPASNQGGNKFDRLPDPGSLEENYLLNLIEIVQGDTIVIDDLYVERQYMNMVCQVFTFGFENSDLSGLLWFNPLTGILMKIEAEGTTGMGEKVHMETQYTYDENQKTWYLTEAAVSALINPGENQVWLNGALQYRDHWIPGE